MFITYNVVIYIQRLHRLMMAQDRTESNKEPINHKRDINQFPLNAIKLMQWHEKINIKMCRQRMSILFNQIFIKEERLPKHTHTHTYIYIYIYIKYLKSQNQSTRGCPRDVMVKAMDCGIIVSELVLQSRYYIHFRANTLGKGMKPLILPAMG